MKCLVKKLLSIALSVMVMCSAITAIPFVASADGTNLAVNATATANGVEADSFAAANANDDQNSTRWASPVQDAPHWLQLEFSTAQTVSSFSIKWERDNITSYKIQHSNDGTTWEDAYTFASGSNKNAFTQNINLQNQVTAKYFRLYIDGFTADGSTESGSNVTWNNLSVYEFKLFNTTFAQQTIYPAVVKDLSTEANSLTVADIIELDQDRLTIPTVDGLTVEFNGADYEQIISADGTVHHPLNDKYVNVSFNVSDGETTETSKDYKILVKGTNTDQTGNEKPTVIPELAEWQGGTGDFTLAANPKLVIDQASYDSLTDKEKTNLATSTQTIVEDFADITGKTLTVKYGTEADVSNGDIFVKFVPVGSTRLGGEGYMMQIGDSITVEAETNTAFFWSTRSILQILKQTDGTIPQGKTYDYPRFSVRGFMLDVGRTPITLETLYDVVKNMSWYKLNDFGVHLYDNYIWVEEYNTSGDKKDEDFGAYSAFRLESDIKAGGNNGKNKADLTATDLYYTKDEFRKLITDSRAMGVGVVPEFDAPAHSLSLTKVRPDLTMEKGSVSRWVDHLDLSNPETLEFMKQIWDEYLTGDNPVFDEDTIINIGTDEYTGDKEDFRKFTDDMIKYGESTGRTVRLWGSLTAMNGETEVDPSNSQLYVWNSGYANPKNMFKDGFDLINILDGSNYIVPAAGYYGDYLSDSGKYTTYDPSNFGGSKLPSGDDQVLGGAYAIWNDMVDKRDNGMSDYDIFDRFFAPIVGYSSNLWGNIDNQTLTYNEAKAVADVVSTAPNSNPYNEVDSKTDDKVAYNFASSTIKDTTGNGYNVTEVVNAAVVNEQGKNALKLNGGESYVSTPIEYFGDGAELSMSVYRNSDSTEPQILCETSDKFETSAIYAVQEETGKVGFTRENTAYSFDYTLPVGEWVDLKFVGHKDYAELFVNGELVSTVDSTTFVRQVGTNSIGIHATLMIPFAQIGSKTSAFNGLVADVNVYQESPFNLSEENVLDRTNFTVTSDNENPRAGSEGPATLAFDGDASTFWHSNYTPYTALPASVTIDMQEAQSICKFVYVPRQDGTSNGHITSYEVSVKLNESDEWTVVATGNWAGSSDTKVAKFDDVEARYVKFTALTGTGTSTQTFASASEFYIIGSSQTAGVAGDVNSNGSIDSTDATLVLQHYAEINLLTADAAKLADVNNNDAVDATDATLILQYYAQIIDSFGG